MVWTKHISLHDAVIGNHPIGENTILIQIVNRGDSFPKPLHHKDFKEIYKFDFNDISTIGAGEITNTQAKDIAIILKNSLEAGYNIVVHCHAGICRSGAVAEVAEILGYNVLNHVTARIPNVLVKYKLMKELGYSYEDS